MTHPTIEEIVSRRYPMTPGYQDTDTSKAAAKRMEKPQSEIQSRILTWLGTRREIGGTPDEFAEAMGIDILSARPRFTELKARGLILATDQRRKNARGNSAVVYRVGQ